MAVVAEPGNLVLTRVTQATVVPAKAGIQEIPRKRASRNDGFMMRLPCYHRAGIGAKSPKLTTPLILSLSKDVPKEEPPDRERWFDKLTMSGYLLPERILSIGILTLPGLGGGKPPLRKTRLWATFRFSWQLPPESVRLWRPDLFPCRQLSWQPPWWWAAARRPFMSRIVLRRRFRPSGNRSWQPAVRRSRPSFPLPGRAFC